jgi:single-strand DNA-binding protein
MGLNRVTLLGNVGKDPDIRYLDSGVCVAQFSFATTEKGYTTQSGQTVADRTEWHNLVAWRGLAQTIEKYVKKGDKLYVEGELRYNKYTGQDGVERRSADIYLSKMDMLTPKGESKPIPPMPEEPAKPQQTAQQPAQQTAPQQPKPQAQPAQQQMDFSQEPGDVSPF